MSIDRALISVSDKTGLADLGLFLKEHGVEIISTGGSAQFLREAGVPVTEVSDHTGFPEIMDGRVKTLHPKVHGGLLGKRDSEAHRKAMDQNDIHPIDLLIVNLYPFESTVSKGSDFETCIENIDIGGPALIRAAAKNHRSVTVVTHPDDYEIIMTEMRETSGSTTPKTRRRLAAAAFARTGAYDAAISGWFSNQTGERFLRHFSLGGERAEILRYGENPHQEAAFYRGGIPRPGVASAKQLQGKELSYNNLNDTDAAFELVAEFEQPAVAIIKHANPCGVAEAGNISEAYKLALKCDPVSAFGGIIAMNRPLDAATAEEMSELFLEVIIAPEIEPEALRLLAKKKNLRVLESGMMPDPTTQGLVVKPLSGGFLLQSRDNARITAAQLTSVTKRSPTPQELEDLLFAFSVCKHVKSNAIVYVKGRATVGIGAGQMSRVDSCRIAAQKSTDAAKAAGEEMPLVKGSVVASDAFFPFADGLIAAADAGVTAVIQPGGSIRDDEVIAAADERNLAMVFTGTRHFRH
ncbi:MAG: bifunctional phosphoribosylaminoimidazolecarboxamide formyltransferase/IMP cyclohydrolase [Rhodospirillaceae bacterium]